MHLVSAKSYPEFCSSVGICASSACICAPMGLGMGLLETAVTVVWSLLLSQVLPCGSVDSFTCSYPAFRNSAVMLVLLYVLGFFACTQY